MQEIFELPHTEFGFVIGRGNPRGLGLRLIWEDGRVVSRFTLPPEAAGFAGIAHGGVLAAVLDEVMGWAPTVQKRRMAMAAEITVRYLRPTPVGVPLVAAAWMTQDRRRLWLAEGRIEGEDGTAYVKGKGTFVPLSAEESARIEAEILHYPAGTEKLFSG